VNHICNLTVAVTYVYYILYSNVMGMIYDFVMSLVYTVTCCWWCSCNVLFCFRLSCMDGRCVLWNVQYIVINCDQCVQHDRRLPLCCIMIILRYSYFRVCL